MQPFLKILSLVKNYRGYALLNIVFNLAAILFSLVSLTMVGPFLGVLFDKIEPSQQIPPFSLNPNQLIEYFYYHLAQVIEQQGKEKGLLFICLVVAVVFLLKNLFRYLAVYFLAPIRNGVVKDLRTLIYEKILSLPLAYFTEQRKGDLLSRSSVDVQEVEWGVLSVLEIFFKAPITILLYLAALIYISPILTLLALIILPLTGLLIAQIGKSLKRVSLQAQGRQGNLLSILEESIQGLRVIKAFNASEEMKAKFETENEFQTRLMNRVLRRKESASPLTEVLAIVVVIVVLYVGGKIVLGQLGEIGSDGFSAESFITFMLIFSQIITPAKAFTTAYYRIIKGMASMDRIEEILEIKNPIVEDPQPLSIEKFEKSIEYKNVSFAYADQPEQKVLKNITTTIEKGKTIALVGQSGAGKSTFVDLLPRFFDPTEGSISIDGIPIQKMALSNLRSILGVVTQQSILFNDTVANNIKMGIKNATEADIIQAAKIANAHDFIMNLEKGYQSKIGEQGNKLSGGEKQRLTIARAILKNPPILVLDEATSSLDAESEKLVQDALFKLMENRTSIVIAHRLSTIQKADEIWLMRQGQIVERGTHQSLMQQESSYRKLAELQGL